MKCSLQKVVRFYMGKYMFGTSKVHLFENATELFKYTKWHHDRSFIRNCIKIVQ